MGSNQNSANKSINRQKKKSAKSKSLIKDESQLRNKIQRTTKEPIQGAELIHHKDSLHYLRGGLDQITCKLATKKGNTIAFSFHALKEIKDPIKQAKILGRMQQNMSLCQKFKTKTKIIDTFSNQINSAFSNLLKKKY